MLWVVVMKNENDAVAASIYNSKGYTLVGRRSFLNSKGYTLVGRRSFLNQRLMMMQNVIRQWFVQPPGTARCVMRADCTHHASRSGLQWPAVACRPLQWPAVAASAAGNHRSRLESGGRWLPAALAAATLLTPAASLQPRQPRQPPLTTHVLIHNNYESFCFSRVIQHCCCHPSCAYLCVCVCVCEFGRKCRNTRHVLPSMYCSRNLCLNVYLKPAIWSLFTRPLRLKSCSRFLGTIVFSRCPSFNPTNKDTWNGWDLSPILTLSNSLAKLSKRRHSCRQPSMKSSVSVTMCHIVCVLSLMELYVCVLCCVKSFLVLHPCKLKNALKSSMRWSFSAV